MKVKCVKCKIDDMLTEEEVADIANIINKNPKIGANAYTRILSIMRGKTCLDKKEHIFIFHEEFNNTVADIIKEYRRAIDMGMSVDDIILRLKKLTGIANIELWS